MDIPKDLIEMFGKGKRVVVLTGAGVSKESGIPTFREAQTGLWAKYNPMELATPQAFQRNPKLVWEWYQWRQDLISKANPNPGHFSLVKMEALIPNFVLITQNIDGLHKRAGSENIIELHGNIFRYRCFKEDVIIDNLGDFSDVIPRCPYCGGYLRPDVVWFGEPLPSEALTKAMGAAQNTEIFLSVGTSALVHPAASLPLIAMDHGAIVVEINPDETQITNRVHYSLQGPSGEILPQLVELAWESNKKGRML
jgi:NAD-dependent deacetylase